MVVYASTEYFLEKIRDRHERSGIAIRWNHGGRGGGGGAYQHDCKTIKDTKYMYCITKQGLNTEPPQNKRIALALAYSVDPVEMAHFAAFQLGLHFSPKNTFRSH